MNTQFRQGPKIEQASLSLQASSNLSSFSSALEITIGEKRSVFEMKSPQLNAFDVHLDLNVSAAAELVISSSNFNEHTCTDVQWFKSADSEYKIQDCINLGYSRYWYGGPELYESYFASNKS